MGVLQNPGAARRTPWELVFGDAEFETEHFPAIDEELESRGAANDPGAFVMLASVGRMLRALRPPRADEPGGPGHDAVLHYGALAWQAWQFRVHGTRVYTLDAALLDRLIGAGPIGPWTFEAPHPAAYLQLPRHRVWVELESGSAPEPVDGFFWTAARARLDIVLCTGLRRGRPGMGVVEVTAALPAEAPGHWGDIEAREDGSDFANILPGGELERLYALTNAAEALKLVSRIFRHAARPGAVGEPVGASPGADADSPHALPPSALPAMPIRDVGDRA